MAGGKGLRLRPLTKNCPKPMLKIKGKPILEWIILMQKNKVLKYIYNYKLSFSCNRELFQKK